MSAGCGKDLHQERIRQEGVVMHLDPGDVANYLEDFAAADGEEERPCAEVYAEVHLDEEQEGEYAEVEGVSDEGGVIVHLSPGEGASTEGTESGIVVEGCVCVEGGRVAHVGWEVERKKRAREGKGLEGRS